MLVFIRRCQECGHRQKSKHPQDYKNDSWQEVKCLRCKSRAMDYGSWQEHQEYRELARAEKGR